MMTGLIIKILEKLKSLIEYMGYILDCRTITYQHGMEVCYVY